jgi:4-alpha-glucanotransferase
MGLDGSTESNAARALAQLDRSERRCLLAPVRVVVRSDSSARTVRLRVPRCASALDWHVELHQEDGVNHTVRGRCDPARADRNIDVDLPAHPPCGYHRLRVVIEPGGSPQEADQLLIVSPGRCTELAGRLESAEGEADPVPRRAFGVWTNLYTLRSRRNWGVGDLADTATLIRSLASCGAVFVGISPLHALFNQGDRISPYGPVSRLFRSPVYLDIEAVPEFAVCPEAQALVASDAFGKRLAAVREATRVDYETIATLKLDVLRRLYDVFRTAHVEPKTERGLAYAEYVENQGPALDDFATFWALHESFSTDVGSRRGWRDWPEVYRHPGSPEVAAFRTAHPHTVDFHRYVQFELDRQLAATSKAARLAGMPLGLYPDLAIGSAPDGSDAWAWQDLWADGVELGAPPDPYAEAGQTWGFPPMVPCRLRQQRYDYWIRLLRASLTHVGMLRIDHILGLFRQYWVPDGLSTKEGAYVRYPTEALLGILALESQRHHAVIVGEDLGTVAPEVPGVLAKWGILSSSVMYFERRSDGSFRAPRDYSKRALVTATTHDHVPLAGFWTGRDLDIRAHAGFGGSDEQREHARRERAETRGALLRALVDEGIPLEEELATPEAVCAAVHAFLARTPAPLVGVSLDDLAGEEEPVNLPGIPVRRYRSWSRRMKRPIEELLADPAVRRVLAEIRAARSDAEPAAARS